MDYNQFRSVREKFGYIRYETFNALAFWAACIGRMETECLPSQRHRSRRSPTLDAECTRYAEAPEFEGGDDLPAPQRLAPPPDAPARERYNRFAATASLGWCGRIRGVGGGVRCDEMADNSPRRLARHPPPVFDAIGLGH